jgi:hypothetical protein
MSFDKMKFEELVQVAEDFAVDITGLTTKGQVLGAIADDGVLYEKYAELKAAKEANLAEIEAAALAEKAFEEEEDLEPVEDTIVAPVKKGRKPKEEMVVVKMHRPNFYYEVGDKVFTKEHPFVVMTPEEAQDIFDHEEGFHLATPRETQEYYS